MDTIFNTDGCFYRALDDEPIFVLLARDPCFAETIRAWETSRQALIGRGEKPQGDHKMLLEALATATAGVVWRNDATDPANGFDAGEHARWHVEPVPARELVEVVRRRVRKDTPEGGHVLPYEEWERVKRLAMPLGNRFLIGDVGGDLVLWENMNYRKPGHPEDWTGYYPVQNSLQKDMLWLAYEDWRNQSRNTVAAIKRLAGGEVPYYANILRRANEMRTEGCPSELLTKYLTTFADDMPVTFYAGDIRKALEALRRERDLAGRSKVFKYFENDEDEEGREITPLSATRISEFLDYATSYGEFNETTPNGTPCPNGGSPMNDSRRTAIWCYKKVLGIIPEDATLEHVAPVTSTSGAGTIDPAKEALWIDMAEERGFLSADEAAARRAELPEGTKAAIPSKHLMFIVGDLGRKLAVGLRQVTADMAEAHLAYSENGDDYVVRYDTLEQWMDRLNGYAAELDEATKPPAAKAVLSDCEESAFNPERWGGKRIDPAKAQRPIAMSAALGAAYGGEPLPEGMDPYKVAFGPVPAGVYYGVEEGNFYDILSRKGMGNDFHKAWWPRRDEFVSKVHDEFTIPNGHPLNPPADDNSPAAILKSIADTMGLSYAEIAEDYRRVHGLEPEKAESDTLDVTDTPEMPPHRFTMFTKARGWAYGRGLEINPAHIPDMLDRMEGDGWHLQAVFGGVEATKVGMLFKRIPPMVEITMEDYWRPAWLDSVEEMMRAPTEGVDDLGRGLQP